MEDRTGYERLYRADLEKQIREFIDRWQDMSGRSGLLWVVDGVDAEVNVRGVRVRPGGALAQPPTTPVPAALPPTAAPDPLRDPTGRRARVEQILTSAKGPRTVDQIRKQLEAAGDTVSINQLHQLLARMVDSDQIVRAARGQYVAR